MAEKAITEKELNMDEKVTVKNIAPWDVGFPNIATRGDTNIAPSSKTRIKREELFEQVNANNKLLAGIDFVGSHATLIIEDEDTRKALEFDSPDGKHKQNVITDEKIKAWFDLKTFSSFEKNIRENVVTRAEKAYLLKAIERLKLNEYDKIAFCQEWCKFRLTYR